MSSPAAADAERLRARLGRFIGERHLESSPSHHRATADYIAETLAAHGFELERQPVEGPFGTGYNIVGRRLGTRRPERTWMVGAHYDTVPGTPGADDNGSAVAGVLELAELLAEHRFEDTVELVAWDMEEVQTLRAGALLGSKRMARAAKRARRDIGGVIDLEMIGLCLTKPGTQSFPPGFERLFPETLKRVRARGMRGDFLAAIANGKSKALLTALEDAARQVGLPFERIEVVGFARLIPHFYRSDHAPFWKAGYPALMLTDTADFRSSYYHRPTDTMDTLDFDFIAKVVDTVAHALVRLAKSERRAP